MKEVLRTRIQLKDDKKTVQAEIILSLVQVPRIRGKLQTIPQVQLLNALHNINERSAQ